MLGPSLRMKKIESDCEIDCDCANMDSGQWKILPSANGNFTM